MASDQPLRFMPWDKDVPAFYVIDLAEREQIVRNHLSETCVYYAGSHEGCGCAFNYGREYPNYEDDPEELKAGEKSVGDLVEYLSTVLPKSGSLHISSCWGGEENKPPELFREIKPDDILQKHFMFRVPELLTIRPADSERWRNNFSSLNRYLSASAQWKERDERVEDAPL